MAREAQPRQSSSTCHCERSEAILH